MQTIPAIDIIDGKCVRLEQGNYDKITLYHNEPLEVAKRFEDAGLKRLHLVDLEGAKVGAVKNWKVLEVIAGKTSLIIDFGGGIKMEKDVAIVFNSGATLATVGSNGVKQIFCTEVSKDGILEGPAIDLYKNIISKFPELHFIASGGISSVNDLVELIEIGCKAAIIGKAIYENRISLDDLTKINTR